MSGMEMKRMTNAEARDDLCRAVRQAKQQVDNASLWIYSPDRRRTATALMDAQHALATAQTCLAVLLQNQGFAADGQGSLTAELAEASRQARDVHDRLENLMEVEGLAPPPVYDARNLPRR